MKITISEIITAVNNNNPKKGNQNWTIVREEGGEGESYVVKTKLQVMKKVAKILGIC